MGGFGTALSKARVEVAAEERREKVEKLLLMRFPIRRIAEEVGVSKTTVVKDIKYIKQVWREHHADAFNEYAAEELQKLLALEQALWEKAMSGHGYSVERILQIMDHRAKLIGLYAPAQSRVAVITEEVLDNAIASYTAQLEQLTIEAGSSESGEIEKAGGS